MTDYQLCLCGKSNRKLWCAADFCNDEGEVEDNTVSKEAAYYEGKTCPYVSLCHNGRLVVYPNNPLLGLLSCQVHWYVDLETKPQWCNVVELALTNEGKLVLCNANSGGTLF